VGVLKGVRSSWQTCSRPSPSREIDFIAVSITRPGHASRAVRLVKDLEIPIEGRHVLFVEDVIDTGLTLSYILRNLRLRQPASLDVCVLFNKPVHRLIDIPLKYKGFDLPDRFVVGYGLDYRERYRNLPFIGLLKPEVFKTNHE
jgi:hypoxanthine phosphoribosyltransferase